MKVILAILHFSLASAAEPQNTRPLGPQQHKLVLNFKSLSVPNLPQKNPLDLISYDQSYSSWNLSYYQRKCLCPRALFEDGVKHLITDGTYQSITQANHFMSLLNEKAPGSELALNLAELIKREENMQASALKLDPELFASQRKSKQRQRAHERITYNQSQISFNFAMNQLLSRDFDAARNSLNDFLLTQGYVHAMLEQLVRGPTCTITPTDAQRVALLGLGILDPQLGGEAAYKLARALLSQTFKENSPLSEAAREDALWLHYGYGFLFMAAKDFKHPEALFDIGIMYYFGKISLALDKEIHQRPEEKAIQYLELASIQGHPLAKLFLERGEKDSSNQSLLRNSRESDLPEDSHDDSLDSRQ